MRMIEKGTLLLQQRSFVQYDLSVHKLGLTMHTYAKKQLISGAFDLNFCLKALAVGGTC